MPWDLSNVKESAGNSEWLLVDLLVWSGLLSCYITQLWSHGLQRWRSTVGFQEVCQISVFTGTLMQYWVVLNSACCTFNTIVLQRSQFMANVSAVSPRCFFFFFKYEGMWTGLHIDVKHLLNLKRLFDFLFFFCYYTENSRSKFKMEQKLQLLQLSFLSIMNPSFSTSVNFCLRGVTLRSLKLDFSFWQR